jgi:energy-coupling factor transport system permease protein
VTVARWEDARDASPLGRASALAKLAVAMVWLLGVVLVGEATAALVLGLLALAVARLAGLVPLRVLAWRIVPLAAAAVGITVFTTLFAAGNADPASAVAVRLGPLVVSEAGVTAGLRVGARLLAIGAISIAFSSTTTPTALVDSLVQQAQAPDRFAYGALAAYGALPRLSADLRALREAHALRGLRVGLDPRLLVALLVVALRHADRLGVAMDARGFGSGPRSHYRPLRWAVRDLVVAVAGLVALAAVLMILG